MAQRVHGTHGDQVVGAENRVRTRPVLIKLRHCRSTILVAEVGAGDREGSAPAGAQAAAEALEPRLAGGTGPGSRDEAEAAAATLDQQFGDGPARLLVVRGYRRHPGVAESGVERDHGDRELRQLARRAGGADRQGADDGVDTVAGQTWQRAVEQIAAVDMHEQRLEADLGQPDRELLEHGRVEGVVHPADDDRDQIAAMRQHDPGDQAGPVAELAGRRQDLGPGLRGDAAARGVGARHGRLRDASQSGDVG